MKAILVMYDSLNRHMLPPYGNEWVKAPNFQRLAERSATFDNCYIGSMACIPARRELHTGRYNFLHRSWGPLEPFDDSMPNMLRREGIHTHLASDHPHYWEDGGATYHTRYSSWEFFRGQEGDPWKGQIRQPPIPARLKGALNEKAARQDFVNRQYYPTEDLHPQTLTFDAGEAFIRENHDADSWLLQIETFDPHEPFTSYPKYRDLYPRTNTDAHFDWPPYGPVSGNETDDDIRHARSEYAALVSMCDHSLGRILDLMDELNLWQDTMLIVCTDHGYMLGEHGWWAKTAQPWFDELAHTPLFIWDPRSRRAGVRRQSLVQMIDIAPTLLDFFGVQATPRMQGVALAKTVDEDLPVREAALFGMHGEHVNVTDGRYVYMRSGPDPDRNVPVYEYTLMPTHMREMFSVDELQDIELAPPFPFSQGVSMMKIASRPIGYSYRAGTLLFDLQTDPGQAQPLYDAAVEQRMATLARDLMRASDAPAEQYERLGLPAAGPIDHDQLLARAHADRSEALRLHLATRAQAMRAEVEGRRVRAEASPDH
ncbi:type I phosphodiesterase / nucleotide pyrophosphatase family protein [Burkholderia ambifaria AMMD]|uniref:Sulfatase n=1 Tax=Burkholderia ambifaria (strain ATCC BAA-244 / DSM 16087 / CCUG 44356 / LMG 19182 / AMMD) TaxID=339670 RepID=Q0BAJ7_BURCM|nr:sulfatase [Burkholderia ambifaria]ABI88826.1 sulfatase [Burkholderia ambifaria AMMD]AJY24233.1 type I phosphodiesterase / nucleotide pyrophosphatase family protein [Burkholderia ambifaria AMMD]MBR7934942.1 sulfatase [Burkholderia ambifaria]PEH69135.1 sulfatase [Burkholderia ambifaria]QQC06271.1 sulfatase [Burkholderia ambifaria]